MGLFSYWRLQNTALAPEVADMYQIMVPVHTAGAAACLPRNMDIIEFGAAVTADCRNPEAAMRWLDAQFETENMLISQNGAEFFEKIVCHAFTTGSGSLAARTVFTAERYGEFVADETKKNKAFVNGQEIPTDEYADALTEWRLTWQERMGESPVILAQTPIFGEFELSGWPIE